ncbi:MAG TPA: cytochrome c biogenesis heme-transporting ATPase CcmA [Usitatibacter sp.]|nr:cytochrome c biogenesis heme-transporting ATPase CcmA [Usitatibacter sp.]
MSALEVRGLACARGDVRLFRDVSFAAVPGEWIALTGANGSGKTTLLRCVAGLVRPEAGELLWDGRPAHARDAPLRERAIFVGHAPGVKDDLTAGENLRDALTLRGVVCGANAMDEALAHVGLSTRRRLAARRLSAGQRRRIALARLWLDPAPVWLLDEPLAALDAGGEKLFTALLERHLARGGLAIIATHHALVPGADREVRLGS